MGILRALRLVKAVESAPKFAIDSESIPPAFFGLSSYEDPTSPAPRIGRRVAIQLGAVKRSRDLIAGTLGTLPVQLFTPQKQLAVSSLLDQPEPDVAASVTYTRLFEDLLFEGVAWWRILKLGAHGYPVSVRRLEPRSVNVQKDGKVYVSRSGQHQGQADEWVPDEQLIRFDSPNDGLLIAGARAIRTALLLAATVAGYANEPMPLGYFSPADDADPEGEDEDDDEIEAILNAWQLARQSRATGYVPAHLKYNPVQFDPKRLQLDEAQQTAVVEISRHAGVDPEDLGVSTTSRTYFNAESKRKDKLDFTLEAFVSAVEGRLKMPDVTPRGYVVRLNRNAFLRSDTKTRYETYAIALSGANPWLTVPEIRELEDRPPMPAAPEVPAMPDTNTDNVRQLPQSASRALGTGFAADPPIGIQLDAPQSPEQFSVDVEKRTISGLLVPYGVTAKARGKTYQFAKGSIRYADVSRVKLWIQHDPNRAVGYATQLEDTDAGLFGTFKVARGDAGDEALIMAEDRVWDGFSVGLLDGSEFDLRDGVFHAVDAPLGETSLTPSPAFDDARVHAVAASAEIERNITMADTTVSSKPEATAPTTGPAATTTTEPLDFSAVTQAIEAGFANLQMPQLGAGLQVVAGPSGPVIAPREPVSAGAQLQVTEEAPYRFDGSTAGQHIFTDDLRDAQNGNQEAKHRLEMFMEEAHHQFAVTSANAAAFNPTQNRPELYVPQLRYTRPVWESVSTGVIIDKTPFTVPKFGAAAGLAGDHTEGTEPTPGSFSATVQTVTPSAISGKVEINREVWDQGGNPQTDTIVWNEMQNAYFEAIEVKIVAMLNALAAATLYSGGEIQTVTGADAALNAALTNLLVDLQFVRGGNRYSAFLADGGLYKAIAAAKDTAGRPLFPLLGPTNANGQIEPVASSANVLGQTVKPAWALNVGVANAWNSYLFVPGSVWQWASAPKRFTFEYQVKSIDMAVWGYTGGAVLRNSDVARIDYTPSGDV